MTFEIHSNITNRSMTVAARAMRKVLRRKRNIIWAIFSWSVFLFNALLLIPFDGEPFTLDITTVTVLLAEVMLLSVLLFRDRFNGMIACKNTLAGTKAYHFVFGKDSYTIITEVVTSTLVLGGINRTRGAAKSLRTSKTLTAEKAERRDR